MMKVINVAGLIGVTISKDIKAYQHIQDTHLEIMIKILKELLDLFTKRASFHGWLSYKEILKEDFYQRKSYMIMEDFH